MIGCRKDRSIIGRPPRSHHRGPTHPLGADGWATFIHGEAKPAQPSQMCEERRAMLKTGVLLPECPVLECLVPGSIVELAREERRKSKLSRYFRAHKTVSEQVANIRNVKAHRG